MKKLKASSQYKKDYKRFRNNPGKVEALKVILQKLANEEPIPEKNNPHKLTGVYKGIWNAISRVIFCLYGLILSQTK